MATRVGLFNGRSLLNLNDAIKLASSNTPARLKIFRYVSYNNGVTANVVLKFSNLANGHRLMVNQLKKSLNPAENLMFWGWQMFERRAQNSDLHLQI